MGIVALPARASARRLAASTRSSQVFPATRVLGVRGGLRSSSWRSDHRAGDAGSIVARGMELECRPTGPKARGRNRMGVGVGVA